MFCFGAEVECGVGSESGMGEVSCGQRDFYGLAGDPWAPKTCPGFQVQVQGQTLS